MKKIYALISLCTTLYTTSLHTETITASQFNQLYSCSNPYIATETTTIILDEDIVINQPCELFQAGGGFGANDRIVFTSSDSHAVQVDTGAFWHIGVTLQFTGNAYLLIKSGAIIELMNNVTMYMSENSRYITVPVS